MNELNDWRLQSCSPRYILLRKCFFILIVMFFSMMTSFTSFGQTKERITLKLENMALEQVLKRIELESGYRMLYNKDLVATVKGITIQVNDELLATVLDRCLDGTNLSYMIKENTIIIAKKGTENRIEVTATIIKGVVKDKKGEPLVGVSVVIAGTATGTATDVNGNFSLPVKDSTGTLLFTYIGFKMQRVVFHRGKEVLVVMDEDLSELDAVTVIAYGSRKKRELIGAVSSVKADEMKELPTASFENLLQGRMSGVEVVNQSGAPGGGGTLVVVRGYNTFNSQFDEPLSNSAPLYVIDGVPMYSFTSPRTGTNTIAEIDPSIIESVEVLKDAASAAIYGSRGGNGVILITTKKGKQGHSNFSANFSYTGSIFPKAPKHYGGMMERNYNIAALKAYRTASLFTGEYPNSIAEGSGFMGGQYDYFWNKGNPIDKNDIKALRVLQDSLNPFYNNATQEKTAPGSTYKPLAAITGLTEGAISADTYVTCDGIYDNVEPNVKCWVYPNAHGTLDVVGALTNSCNVFFCNLGYNLGLANPNAEPQYDEDGKVIKQTYSSEQGLEKLKKYATMFGLDSTSGLEIPETDPQISDEDSVRSAMGQGTNDYTTSQLARYITAVANEGTVYDLSLIDRVEDIDGDVILQNEPKIKNTVEGISKNTWDLVHAGMQGVVTNNPGVFGKIISSDITLSGKTGTAQQGKTHPDHGLFVGFAPSNSPEVAWAIRIANGYSSSRAAEVGRDVMKYYYNKGDKKKIITGEAATIGSGSGGD